MSRPSSDQRKALGRFLAAKRASVTPRDVGLPSSSRRSPGLRREEIAVLAGVSISWYTWIEQGRDVQASSEVLRRLATILRLDHVETAHLFSMSLHAPPVFASSEELSVGFNMLVQAVDPIPAYIRNSRFDIIAWNAAAKMLFVDYDMLPPQERNTLKLMFLYPPYRDLILNWSSIAHCYVSSFRAARARARDKRPFDLIVGELSEASVEFRTWWAEVGVEAFDEGHKRVDHPTLGIVDYTYVALSPEGQPDLSFVTYLLRTPGGTTASSPDNERY